MRTQPFHRGMTRHRNPHPLLLHSRPSIPAAQDRIHLRQRGFKIVVEDMSAGLNQLILRTVLKGPSTSPQKFDSPLSKRVSRKCMVARCSKEACPPDA